jgi:methionyl-tRNA synthetase
LPPPRRITVHGFLLHRGEKISKSGARSVTLDDLLADFGADGLRHYLLRDNPIGSDGHFSYDRILARYNADLANTLGNLVARVTTLVASHCSGVGPPPGRSSTLAGTASRVVDEACSAWAEVQPAEALAAAPWRHPQYSAEAARALGDTLEALRIIAILTWPAIPAAADQIWARLGLPGGVTGARVPGDLAWGGYPGGLPVTKSTPLFPRKLPTPKPGNLGAVPSL